MCRAVLRTTLPTFRAALAPFAFPNPFLSLNDMAVALRLMRMGRKKAPLYAIVATDSRSRRDGRFIEDLGRYEPVQEPAVVKVNAERVMYWLRQGAQPSDTVRNLLSKEGIMLHLHLVRKGKTEEEIAEALDAFQNRGAVVKTKLTKRARATEALKAEEATAREREAAEAKARAEREAELNRQRAEAEAKEREERAAAAAAAAEEVQRATAEASARQAAADAETEATSADVRAEAAAAEADGPSASDAASTLDAADQNAVEGTAEALGVADVPSPETVQAAVEAEASADEAIDSTESGTDSDTAPDVAPAVDDATGRDREAMLSDVEAIPPSVTEDDGLTIEGPDAAKTDDATSDDASDKA